MNQNPKVRLDLRGEVCPWPAAYTTAKLKRMTSGEVLEVIADGMCAVDGIPAAVKQSGDSLLSVETIGDGVYRFLVQVA